MEYYAVYSGRSSPILGRAYCYEFLLCSTSILPWVRVLFEKLVASQLVKLYALYGTCSFVAVFTKAIRLSLRENKTGVVAWSLRCFLPCSLVDMFTRLKKNFLLLYHGSLYREQHLSGHDTLHRHRCEKFKLLLKLLFTYVAKIN